MEREKASSQIFVCMGLFSQSKCTCMQGYKNRPNFSKFGENWRNRAGPNFKTAEFTVHYFKISEKDKS
jgi:hypothetical protein